MNKQLSEAIARLDQLSHERQEAAAALLFDFLERDDDVELTPEQLTEIDRRLDDEHNATDEEVKAFFERKKT
ncbi:MAG TPA: hypothetical protein VH684_22755 [Xanthobacteraceae bacterium]|jgi:hypothetical protein